ncbi:MULTISPECIES: hypothetical protein [Acidiplasma]|uniref:Uncharacterized protein n=2 Tax=Acidiplasma TaxID=507753 RepID=A0A0Q0RQL0_9ARCH|nr:MULTISPECIES: hypothetical protein [Acidiplasma]KQB34570.1 hypothetical protein AOG54_00805 [Acidiplasma aeolicum]
MDKFPTFHCLINQKDEGYDADIQLFFTREYELAMEVSRLIELDNDSIQYSRILKFIQSFENFLITGEKPDDFQFLKTLPSVKGWKDDYNIIQSRNRVSRLLFRAVLKTVEVMYYYEKMSKKDDYKHRFLPEYFEAFWIMRDVFYQRALDTYKK